MLLRLMYVLPAMLLSVMTLEGNHHTMQSAIRGDEDDTEHDGASYQLEMMRCLREINVDNNTVGW